VQTLKIDDMVARGDVPRIDFIEMDIEGAELEALKSCDHGVYDFKDFGEIPQFLDRLVLGYRFYLRHFTFHGEETVLFAGAEREEKAETLKS